MIFLELSDGFPTLQYLLNFQTEQGSPEHRVQEEGEGRAEPADDGPTVGARHRSRQDHPL